MPPHSGRILFCRIGMMCSGLCRCHTVLGKRVGVTGSLARKQEIIDPGNTVSDQKRKRKWMRDSVEISLKFPVMHSHFSSLHNFLKFVCVCVCMDIFPWLPMVASTMWMLGFKLRSSRRANTQCFVVFQPQRTTF